MAYHRRIIDDTLDELFPHLAAVALEGAKGVGKTATAYQRASTVLDLSNPPRRQSVAGNHDLVTEVEPPVLIDEWQLEPTVWDRIKRAVDDGAPGGTFLLAGSAGVPPDARVHSGAGRIVSLPMRPLSVAERDLDQSTVSLRDILAGKATSIEGSTTCGVSEYTEEILRSGFPGIRQLPERARNAQLDSYLARIVDRELPENGVSVRRPTALRQWLAAYGAATSSDAAYSTILDAATPGEGDKPARQTVAIYREQLARLFVLDPLPAWTASFTPLTRLTHTPKHHLVDPALAARLTGVGTDGLLRGDGRRVTTRADTSTWLGALFESLVVQSVRVYAQAADAMVGHLRTKDTVHEVDVIVERPDRGIIAIEIKLSGSVDDSDVRHLDWLRATLGDRVIDRVVINTGPYAYRRADGVAVVPLALLGP